MLKRIKKADVKRTVNRHLKISPYNRTRSNIPSNQVHAFAMSAREEHLEPRLATRPQTQPTKAVEIGIAVPASQIKKKKLPGPARSTLWFDAPSDAIVKGKKSAIPHSNTERHATKRWLAGVAEKSSRRERQGQ